MNRRRILSAIAGLPFIGALVPKAATGDGVALTATSHPIPIGATVLADEINPDFTETIQVDLPVYAIGGETVTCENGHAICDFSRTVMVGQNQNLPRDLTNWRQPEPVVGQLPPPVCATCGAKFYVAGGVFHIGDTWRNPIRRPLHIQS